VSPAAPFDGHALVDALIDAEVEFVAIGGFAVIAHGYSRMTDDLDIVPAPDEQNLARLAAMLQNLDYRIVGTDELDPDELVHPDLEGLLAGGSWVLTTKHGGLDILQLVEPDLEYEALAREAITEEIYGRPVRFCGYRHLVAMKEAAGRPQDLADLVRLRAIRGEAAGDSIGESPPS
jgi:hypothetical protein